MERERKRERKYVMGGREGTKERRNGGSPLERWGEGTMPLEADVAIPSEVPRWSIDVASTDNTALRALKPSQSPCGCRT
jgi:hypothetical protein